MPTGYTADVMSGKIVDFDKFAMQCARGMGALVMMRDDPWDAPIPEKFEPHDYNAKSRSYKYTDPRNCLAAQYWRAHGLPYRVPFAMFRFWSKKFDVRMERIAVDKPRTFGAALTRARAALTSQKGNANG